MSSGGVSPKTGNLDHWARQGVLLLNATLTVRANQAGSHQKKGWEQFTDAVIKAISDQKEHIVFLLWGKCAQEKGKIIDRDKHFVLAAPHPSPFSVHSGFFGCKHFSQTNEYLISQGNIPINWNPLFSIPTDLSGFFEEVSGGIPFLGGIRGKGFLHYARVQASVGMEKEEKDEISAKICYNELNVIEKYVRFTSQRSRTTMAGKWSC